MQRQILKTNTLQVINIQHCKFLFNHQTINCLAALLLKEAITLLEATLREEKAADRKLIEAATNTINIEAAKEKA